VKNRFYILLILLFGTHLYAQDTNPFSIYRTQTDSAEQIAAVIPVNETEEPVTKLEGDNPFSVSHIPIRKNQYKKIESLKAVPRQNKETISIAYLPLWIILGSLCALAYILFLKKNHLQILFRSILNDNFLRMTSYDEAGGQTQPYFLGYLLFIVNISLFLTFIAQKIFDANESYLLLKIFSVCSLFFVAKHLVISFFSWVFEFTKEADLYQFTIVTFRNILAVSFLTLNILFVFGGSGWSKFLAATGILIFIIALLSRYYKGIRIARNYINNNFFHFFIYFCALEIGPWVICYKMAKGLF